MTWYRYTIGDRNQSTLLVKKMNGKYHFIRFAMTGNGEQYTSEKGLLGHKPGKIYSCGNVRYVEQIQKKINAGYAIIDDIDPQSDIWKQYKDLNVCQQLDQYLGKEPYEYM